ncbi:MAG: MATE family efflux transporter [Polyangiaceae bacterium]|jgi:MATE family multidrug resistance protein
MTALSWHHRPFLALLRLAWPASVSMVSFSIMTMVDTLLVGRLGTAELAGVGLAGTTAFVLLCFSFGLLQGAKTLVAQAMGAGRRDAVIGYVGVALCTAVALGVLTTVAGELASLVIGRMTSTVAAGAAARTYLRIRALAAPVVLVQVALREVRQAQGDVRSPMVATVAANLVNMALAVTLIFRFGWGVAGAAIATIVAHCVEAGVLVVVQRVLGGLGIGCFTYGHILELARVGIPTAFQFMLEVGAFATLTVAVSTFSELDMAGHQIALQIVHFSFLPCVAVGEAASILCGQAVGANRDDLVRSIARRGASVAAGYAAICSTAMLMFGHAIVGMFTLDAVVAAVAYRLLQLAALFGIVDAVNIVARCVLRGTGDVRFAAVVGVVISWLATPLFAWGLGHGLRLGAFGGWLGIFVEVVVSSALLASRVERLGWIVAARSSRTRLEALPWTPDPQSTSDATMVVGSS